MSEFERRKRYLTYYSPDSKRFLRKDFGCRCAYCRIPEYDFGGAISFEKDHFIPQTSSVKGIVPSKYKGEAFDVHSYYNLYYSCKRCNGSSGKSNKWSSTLLNPCEDDIWGVHIRLNDCKIEHLTEQGYEYITTLKLNSKTALNCRQIIKRNCIQSKERLLVLQDMLGKAITENQRRVIVSMIKELEPKEDFIKYYLEKDVYSPDAEMQKILDILNKYKVCECFGDYHLDYSIEYSEKRYFVSLYLHDEIKFINGIKQYEIYDAQLIDWEGKDIMICHFDIMSERLYFVKVDEILKGRNFKGGQQKYTYRIYEDNYL